MDPLTALGGVASIIQIAHVSLVLSSEFRSCVRTIRHAPQELHNFHDDLLNFSTSLHIFHKTSDTCIANIEDPKERKLKRRYIAGVIKECDAVKDGFSTLLEKFLGQPGQLRSISGLLDRLRWYFQKPMVAGLKLSLECAKSSIMLFIVLHMFEDLQRRVKRLQDGLLEVPKELKEQL